MEREGGLVTAADLAKLTVSFNYKVSDGTTFGFRADAAAGGPGLTGLPALSDSGTQVEVPLGLTSMLVNRSPNGRVALRSQRMPAP